MIYLDNGATSLHKPEAVHRAVADALRRCANPGRGGHPAAMEAARQVYACREEAGKFFRCGPEQVVFTMNCTHGLNIAIRSLVQPGSRVVISGFEHNAVTRPLHSLKAKIRVAGRHLFDWEDTLTDFESALKAGADAAVFTHVSNVFGYILPVEEMAALCRQYGVPFVIDAAQSAGALPVNMEDLGADFIAMPGHKGLLGPQGTGILLCSKMPEALLFGGTGSDSVNQEMPDFLPDRLEAGTMNVPGIAGLAAGLRYLQKQGIDSVFRREHKAMAQAAEDLKALGLRVFAGEHQASTVSFLPDADCEEVAQLLAQRGIAVRAGLHCAPLAHESAGTLEGGTVRISFGHDATPAQNAALRREMAG
ncbi:MAG: aminotransferase class V-fold PLP-dependent enzyme, partial [Ruminococcaceae bacterium]|nr:aminotransferase class V-fold PLP-dependent enzyme [Oscillospiraceae bacterium]